MKIKCPVCPYTIEIKNPNHSFDSVIAIGNFKYHLEKHSIKELIEAVVKLAVKNSTK